MPRLAPLLLRYARSQHALLPLLLRECRDLRSAQNELRWLEEHSLEQSAKVGAKRPSGKPGWRWRLRCHVKRRSKGEPLQYILGGQPFGDLNILCRPGVLIPRPETETYTLKLAQLLKRCIESEKAREVEALRILDLCTGSGCIALLLHSLLRPAFKLPQIGTVPDRVINLELEVLGIDISSIALDVAHANLEHNIRTGNLNALARSEVSFKKADIRQGLLNRGSSFNSSPAKANMQLLQESMSPDLGLHYDLLIANPPYISPKQFAPGGITSPSVRKWEPELALVPQQPTLPKHGNLPAKQHLAGPSLPLERGDEFYPILFGVAIMVDANAVVVEIGDAEQAARIASLACEIFIGNLIEVWRDDGSVDAVNPGRKQDLQALARDGRAVVVWRNSWARWRASSEEWNRELHTIS